MVDFAQARRMMVEGQVRTNDVTEGRLLGVMQTLPRERFVPHDKAALAYLDMDLPVGGTAEHPRCLLKPMVLGKLIAAAEIEAGDRVLDVACATGYSTAVLAGLGATVVAVEEDAELAHAAKRNLHELGIANATVHTGPLVEGAPKQGPYDVILINGAIETVPDALRAQLAEGGRLLCVVRRGAAGKAMLYLATAGEITGRPIFEAAAPILAQFALPRAFVF